jgi:uncharacterized protein YbaP (TraB family)
VYVPFGPTRPFLWEVTGAHGSAVLLGTFHPAGEADIPPAALPLLDRADVFVAEADEPPSGGDQVRIGDGWVSRLFIAEPAQSLGPWLTTDELADLRTHTGLRRDDAVRLKPWVVISMVMAAAFEFPDPTISAALLARARDHEIPAEFFDTWDQQVEFLDRTVDYADVRGALADYEHLRCNTINQIAAYRAGDDAAYVVVDPPPGDPGPERVERWSAAIARYLESGRRAFVAIGVGNILGPQGIAANLAARGYLVTRYAAN